MARTKRQFRYAIIDRYFWDEALASLMVSTRAFMRALEGSDAKRLKKLLATEPELLYLGDEEGLAPFFFFVAAEAPKKMVSVFLEAGADPSEVIAGTTALHTAAMFGNCRNVSLLLDHGADPNVVGDEERTPLLIAIMHRNPEAMALLIEHGARVDVVDSHRASALHLAVEQGSETMVDALLKAGAPVSLLDSEGDTPLDLARSLELEKIEQRILEAGGTAGGPRPRGGPVEELRDALASLEPPEGEQRPRNLDPPAKKTVERCARLVREIGPAAAEEGLKRTLARHGYRGTLPLLTFCAKHGLAAVVGALLEVGAHPDGVKKDDLSPIALAASGGWTVVVKLLLDAGADPVRGGSQKHDTSPLARAAHQGHLSVVKLLVEAGAKPGKNGNVFDARGPDRHAIQRYLRSEFRDLILKSKAKSRHAASFKRAGSFDPDEMRGALELDGYARGQLRSQLVGFVQAPLDAIGRDCRARRLGYESDVASSVLVGVTEGWFLFQVRAWPWVIVAPIGPDHDFDERLKELARSMRVRAAIRRPGHVQLVPAETLDEDSFFERERLWVPPYRVEGDRERDPGDINRLHFQNVDPEDISRIDRVTFVD